MLNHIKNIFLYSLLFLGLLSSCSTKKDLTSSNKDLYQELPKSLLWEISGNDLTQKSYLYGTIHMIDGEDFFWPKGTLAAIENTDQMAFEIDMDDMFDMSTQMSLFTKAMMNDNISLKDLMSEEDYKLVSDHFSTMGLPMFLLDKIKPMFLTVFASGDIGMGSLQNGDMKSYEMVLFEIAGESNKEVHGLESIEYQISIFDSIPYKEQADMLLESIKTADTENDQFKEMIDMYKNQSIDQMISMMKEEELGTEGYEDLLLNNRNEDWIPKMSEYMRGNPTFFAVGAGHLAGPKGVIHLLRKEGYELKPLSNIE